jgi:periplasmic protein CpxP/Spy
MTKNSKVRTLVGAAVAITVVGVIAAGAIFAEQQPAGPQGRGMMMGRGQMMGGRGPMGGPMMGIGRGLGQLGLTDQQKTQVKAIFDGHKTDMQGFQTRMQTARKALDDAIWSGADEAAIRAKAADVAAVQADMDVFRSTVHAQVFAVLTPDQQAKASQLHQQGPMGQRGRGFRKGPGF